MTDPDPVAELRRALGVSDPHQRIAQQACETFTGLLERLAAQFESAAIPQAEALELAEDVVSGLLRSFGAAGEAMVQAVARTAAQASSSTRH
jgi:hypothetical protein